MGRPENKQLPPELHYKETSKNYALSTRLNKIQQTIARRCLEILNLKTESVVLDLGCGTGMSGREISSQGHQWVGCDISRDMLHEALHYKEEEENREEDGISSTETSDNKNGKNEFVKKQTGYNLNQSLELQNYAYNTENNNYYSDKNNIRAENDFDIGSEPHYEKTNIETYDSQESNTYEIRNSIKPLALIHFDISNALPFAPGSFDAIISVSCIQWLFHNKSLIESKKIFYTLFNSIKAVLKIDGKAVIQFYIIHRDHLAILEEESRKAGFYSEIITEGDGKNRKMYLVLDCKSKASKKAVKRENPVLRAIHKHKDRRTKKGLAVAKDSKFSGRKRSKKFL